jgi:hypothetical protein
VVIWASAAFAGYESVRKLIEHGRTSDVGLGIAGAVLGIIGNQVVARYKMRVGRRINSATLIADARHSRLDALSSAGALAGLIAVALGQAWGDPVAGIAVTIFICHVGYEVTADVMRRLADGVDPGRDHRGRGRRGVGGASTATAVEPALLSPWQHGHMPAGGFRCHPGGGGWIRPVKHAAIPLITSSKPSMFSGLTTYALACSS